MFKKLTDDAKLPQRATKFSAGFDVFANEDVVIGAGCTEIIGLGIAIDEEQTRAMNEYKTHLYQRNDMRTDAELSEIQYKNFMQSYYLELHIRSSLRVKGLTSLGTGIIDMDFKDEIKMVVHNVHAGTFWSCEEQKPKYEINKGDKIGQLILKRHEGYLLPQEYTLDSERVGGFGSTND